ncbi:type III pantothenate kinase [Pseudoxanthomonas sp. PXM02]|uniref:type III pantothenate kinase n=1 Tax=Pseudoxanthomonas sp. PXM02 TaxID=2769294 RepID=UPI00177AC4A4|nr:type III pantothenate kinase [Pseudoxanthomonas sp. PXM02]MBD9479256.1 type III pantothenate kinase [Pseudoxanthomonas sp. PXM02]
MTQWVFDLGNSRVKCAPLQADGTLGPMLAFAYDDALLAALDAEVPATVAREASTAVLASVASPERTATVVDWLTTRFGTVSIARTQAALAGVRIAYAEPVRMGVDRFLALLAARRRGAGAWLVVGVGTAVTVDLLDAQGRHHGGRIAPSPRLMRDALHAAAAQLPAQGGDYVEFATDTADALASGCEGAALGLIERSLEQACETLGQRPALLLHGGGAPALAAQLREGEMAPGLVLEGLAVWARLGTDA